MTCNVAAIYLRPFTLESLTLLSLAFITYASVFCYVLLLVKFHLWLITLLMLYFVLILVVFIEFYLFWMFRFDSSRLYCFSFF